MATLKDLSTETGLSVGTVSRVLNNRGYISQATRDKVDDAIRKLDYHPNEMARSLSKNKSNIIGVIVPHVDHPYFSSLISALEAEASIKGKQLFVFCTRDRSEKLIEYIEACSRYQTRGIIICSAAIDGNLLKRFRTSMVTIECEVEGTSASICCDNYKGGEIAAQHLIDCGCKNLAVIGGVLNQPMPADRRTDGFAAVCKANDIPHVQYMTEEKSYKRMDYYELVGHLLAQHPQVDGVFAGSDLLAAQLLQACKARNLRVPEDVRIVGFDNANLATLTTPTLTTIAQPIRKMAAKAVSCILNHQNEKCERINMPVTLIKRETT